MTKNFTKRVNIYCRDLQQTKKGCRIANILIYASGFLLLIKSGIRLITNDKQIFINNLPCLQKKNNLVTFFCVDRTSDTGFVFVGIIELNVVGATLRQARSVHIYYT